MADKSRQIMLNTLDGIRLVDYFFRRPPGWALELDEARYGQALDSIKSNTVKLVRTPEGDELDCSRFVSLITEARLYAESIRSEYEESERYREIADVVIEQYRPAIVRAFSED